jgi:hypothetical protein
MSCLTDRRPTPIAGAGPFAARIVHGCPAASRRLRRRTRWAQAPTLDPPDQPSKAAATEGGQKSAGTARWSRAAGSVGGTESASELLDKISVVLVQLLQDLRCTC